MEIFVNKDGRQHGPYTLDQVRDFVANGTFAYADLCWHEGVADWQPISSVISSELSPLEMHKDGGKQSKNDPLSIWSLVLGILSWLCFSILAGIPAIICGHISLRRIKKNPLLRGKGMAIAGLVLGYIQILLLIVILPALALPAIAGALERGKAIQSLKNARQIHLAVQMAAADADAEGKKDIGWPADAGLSSVAEVKQMLVAGGYLTAADAQKLFEGFMIGNVSEEDPPDTIFIKSKPVSGKPSIVFRKGGDGAVYRMGQTEAGTMPPRDPQFLE